jgi:hypothetical protein
MNQILVQMKFYKNVYLRKLYKQKFANKKTKIVIFIRYIQKLVFVKKKKYLIFKDMRIC